LRREENGFQRSGKEVRMVENSEEKKLGRVGVKFHAKLVPIYREYQRKR
jgi:hypothetical protein